MENTQYDITCIHDTIHSKKSEEMRRKEKPILSALTQRGIAIFRAESSHREKQQIKRFRPAFFYRRRIFLGDCERAHVASLRDFVSLDSLLFVRRGEHETRDRQIDRQTDRQTGPGHNGFSDLIYKTFQYHIYGIA